MQDQVTVRLAATPHQTTAALREEWCVVDASCNCRRITRSRGAAERVLASGRLMPDREPGPLRLEHRWVTEWERA